MTVKWQLWRSNSNGSSDSGEEAKEGRKQGRASWSKIAQMLKAHDDPRQRPAQASTLLLLPFELQECITAFLPMPDLLRLRATCWKLDQILLDHVFNEITINCSAAGSQRTGTLLRHLGHRKCRAAQTARTLRIENLVPFTHPHQSDWREQDLDIHYRPIQQNFVVPALKSFSNVTTLHWSVKVSEPYSNMCSTLASLPHLERLYLYFDRWCPTSTLHFDKFGPLVGLRVEARDYTGPVSDGLLDSLRSLLIRCTELEEFSFTLTNKAESLFDKSPESLRILRTTSLLGIQDGLSNLVSLDLAANSEESTAVWDFLAAQATQLSSITVDHISTPLLDYLRTYAGLEALTIRGNPSCPFATLEAYDHPLLKTLCFDILPLHAGSLTKLEIFSDGETKRSRRRHRGMCLVKSQYLAAFGDGFLTRKQDCSCGDEL